MLASYAPVVRRFEGGCQLAPHAPIALLQEPEAKAWRARVACKGGGTKEAPEGQPDARGRGKPRFPSV